MVKKILMHKFNTQNFAKRKSIIDKERIILFRNRKMQYIITQNRQNSWLRWYIVVESLNIGACMCKRRKLT